MANRLEHETSPYLLQHAHNPVDWYPWGEEALARARSEDRPILLSIGYSACHWCHVMERESFENPEIAAQMNAQFVNIKVDREERPDLDSIYMSAVQALTGQGGWPMTVFLMPDGVPFYGGTYFPPEDRGHMPGFPRILDAVAEAYRTRRDEVGRSAEGLRSVLQRQIVPREGGVIEPDMLDRAVQGILENVDWAEGGLRGAPKFPQPMTFEFLLRGSARTGDRQALAAVTLTLDKMALGGIYDHLGGGFHRYSVDAYWLVPHFEKMLYDNAQLVRLYLHAYQATGTPLYRRIVEETLGYVLREMTDPSGGFYSTQDADSEGEEGKFFLWDPGEVEALLGHEDARLFAAYFDITPRGNFEARNILNVKAPLDDVAVRLGVSPERLQQVIDRGRPILLAARSQRIQPHRDDKVLTAWNGMLLRAFAEAGAALENEEYVQAAIRNAEFVTSTLIQQGRALRTWKDGQAKLSGYLEDYANYADGLVALYEATFDERWLRIARSLADAILAWFPDEPNAGFFDTPSDHEALLTRPKDVFDNATPSGNAVAADMLLRLALLTGEDRYRVAAEGVMRLLGPIAAEHPTGFGRLLSALDFALGNPREVAVIGPREAPATRALLHAVFGRYLPNKVVAGTPPGGGASDLPLLASRPLRGDRPTAYVCEHYTCQAPVTEPADLAAQLSAF
ncbi:MAG: thioredoxin domain-containing protein [Chloroflexi bacterium]|nr:thioredoxin domain-containing protein [Chloroflexota bacterium]